MGTCIEGLHDSLVDEICAMARHACANGVKLPLPLQQALGQLTLVNDPDPKLRPTLSALAGLHSQLAELIAPARPLTVAELWRQRQHSGWLRWMGPLPALRSILILSILSLIVFLLLGISPLVTAKGLQLSLFDFVVPGGDAPGRGFFDALATAGVLLSAAALGGCFQAMFQALRYVSNGTYDTSYDSSYFMRIGLGIMSGLMLAELLQPVLFHAGSSDQKTTDSILAMGKPLLALLGGFSANLVYTLLQRLVVTLESLVKGDPRDQREARDAAVRNEADRLSTRQRLEASKAILAVQSAIAQGVGGQQLTDLLNQALQTLVPGTPQPAPQPATSPPPPSGDGGPNPA